MNDVICPSCRAKILDEGVDVVECMRCGAVFDLHPKTRQVFKTEDSVSRLARDNKPAYGLQIAATAGLLGNVFLVLLGFVLAMFRTDAGPAVSEAVQTARDAAPIYQCCCIAIPTILIYPFVYAGGLTYEKRRSYKFTFITAIMAMLPASPGVLIGLPVGIWVIIQLMKPEVRSQFQS